MSRKIVSVADFVETLRSFESQPITSARVAEFCLDRELDAASLNDYCHFQADAYTRNLVYRDEFFEVMALCWSPHQKTPIHTHNGQLGWMCVERGALAVIEYDWKGCNAPENQNVVGMDCLAGATEIDLARGPVQECLPGGRVALVDKKRTIHQVVTKGKEPAVSLHIYSKPIDSCVAFDLSRGVCYRRDFTYHSEYGKVVVTEGDLQASPGSPATSG